MCLTARLLSSNAQEDQRWPPDDEWRKISALEERSQLAEVVLRESEARFRFLNDLSEATHTQVDPEQIIAVMARMLGEHLHASRCAYATVHSDAERFTILHDYTNGCASTVGTLSLALRCAGHVQPSQWPQTDCARCRGGALA
jgi:hypothetical protein